MTQEEILAMEAGEELDRLVYLELLASKTYKDKLAQMEWLGVDSYSRDISAAWQVWLAVTNKDCFAWAIYSSGGGRVAVEHYPQGYIGGAERGCGDVFVEGLFPEAICKAALLILLKEDR